MSPPNRTLDYIDKEIILRSQLADNVKQPYIDRVDKICDKLGRPLNEESDDLACCSECRSLSLKFYRDTGILDELEDVYPAGMESEYEIDLVVEGGREFLCTIEMRAEVEAVARKIQAEGELEAAAEGKAQFNNQRRDCQFVSSCKMCTYLENPNESRCRWNPML